MKLVKARKLIVEMNWIWLPKGFGVANGGSYSKLFQSKGSAEDVVAREVTQNSWDAATRLKKEMSQSGNEVAPSIQFKLQYEFRKLIGADKQKLVGALHLHDIADRAREIGYGKLGLSESEVCLNFLDEAEHELPALYINDFGATGLRGDPTGEDLESSDFYRAFGEIGGNDRTEGGGSYGFGKSAYIRASQIRLVVAYSSFSDQGDGVTRRLWGFIYWQGHKRFSGVGQIGDYVGKEHPTSIPLINEEADKVALELGFQIRDAMSPEHCGTSLLVLDHVLEPNALLESLEKFWWPAISSFGDEFRVEVITEEGVFIPRPASRTYLQPFIRAFDIAINDSGALVENEEFRTQPNRLAQLNKDSGKLALVRAPVEIPEALTESGNPNLIALIRNPRMVVTYMPTTSGVPVLQGCFIADSTIDGYLRSSEPGAHDIWQKDIDASHGENWEEIRYVVREVHKAIATEVNRVKKLIRPRRDTDAATLNFADTLLAKLFKPSSAGPVRSKPKKKQKETRTQLFIANRLGQIRTLENHLVILEEEWEVKLVSTAGNSRAITITPNVWVVSDGTEVSSADKISCEIFEINGKAKQSGTSHSDKLVQGQTLRFKYRTTGEIERDWTIKAEPSFIESKKTKPGDVTHG